MKRQEKSFIQPVIDWEAGLLGRLAATFQINAATRNESSNHFEMYFEKFVKYVLFELETNVKSYGSLHWTPFSKLCDLCHFNFDLIGKVETMSEDLDLMTNSGHLPRSLQKIVQQKHNKNQQSTENLAKAYFKQLDRELTMKLFSYFEEDFIIGNYKFPKDYLTNS